MRILYVAPMNTIHSRRWIEYFVGKGHEVHVADVSEQMNEPAAGSTHHHLLLPPKGGTRLRGYLRRYRPVRDELLRLVHETRPDLVHVHWLDVVAHMLLASGFHPIVGTAWGSDVLVYPRRSVLSRLFLRRILRGFDVFTCDAEHMREEMIRQGAAPAAVRIIYFGTDVGVFHPSRRDPRLVEELGFPPGSKLVISLRALKPIYDIDTFIRAARIVAGRRADARFVIVGDGTERGRLEDLSRELGLSDRLRFVGRLSDDDLQKYTASSDVYVSTSLSDAGLAASTAEAMACEVPVVISRFGNNEQWVMDGKSGFLFPLRDPAALAEKVGELLASPEKAADMGRAGRRIIVERNNWQREMEKVQDLYDEVVKSARGNA